MAGGDKLLHLNIRSYCISSDEIKHITKIRLNDIKLKNFSSTILTNGASPGLHNAGCLVNVIYSGPSSGFALTLIRDADREIHREEIRSSMLIHESIDIGEGNKFSKDVTYKQ